MDDVLTAWSHVESSFPTGVHIFHPVIDGPDGLIPDLPSRLFAQGKFAKLPFIAGTNLDEGGFEILITIPTPCLHTVIRDAVRSTSS